MSVQGFSNLGSTCWFNSLCQTLLSVDAIKKAAADFEPNLQYTLNVLQPEFCRFMRGNVDNHQLYIQFMNQLSKKKTPNTLRSGQQCVDEALHLLIETVDIPSLYHDLICVYETTVQCPTCSLVTKQIRDNPTRDKCIRVLMPGDTRDIVPWLLNHSETVTNYTCDYCKKVQTVTKHERLVRVGSVIIINIDKFLYKLDTPYPETFSIPKKGGGTMNYTLKAVIEHSGNRFGGHYWAKCKRSGKWYSCNDSSVSESSYAPSATSFMLTYECSA